MGDDFTRRVDAALAAATATLDSTRKSLPSGDPEGGVHVHTLERESKRTKVDGAHVHLFQIGDQLIRTAEDGVHTHQFDTEAQAVSGEDGDHVHKITLPDGTELETGAGISNHSHDLLVANTAFDGAHKHTLEVNGETIESFDGGEFWTEVQGSPDQADLPDSPPATVLAGRPVGELEGRDVLAQLERSLQAQPPEGKLPALKVADPTFLLRRLADGDPAGVISRRRSIARLGDPQALVNVVATAKEDTFVWGIVAQGGPVPINLADADTYMPLRHGLDPAARDEFEAVAKSAYYMPLRLLVKFDPPLLLNKARRAGEIDFATDVATVAKAAVAFQSFPKEEDRPWDGDAAVGRLRQWASSDGSGDADKMDWAKYRKGFAWYDAAEPDQFGSYKLPHHDVVDGSVKTLRSGVIAAGNAVQGPRGGVQLPPADFAGVRSHLGKHYKEFDLEPPWDKDSVDKGEFATVHPGSGGVHTDDPAVLADVLAHFDKPMALRMPAVHLVGSLSNHGKSENDIDLLIRGPFDEETRHVIKFRLGRALPPGLSKRVQFLDEDSGGPFTNHIPLYDLVLVPHSDRSLIEMSALDVQDDPGVEDARRAVAKQGHVHSIPGGGMTGEASGPGHRHSTPGGRTSPPISTDGGHVHELPDGRRTGPVREATEASTEKALVPRSVRILKADEEDDTGGEKEERFVFGVVLVPDEIDAQDETYSPEEVRKAAHSFMEFFGGQIKLMHRGRPVEDVKVLETYVTKAAETHGGETFTVGTWLLAARIEDDGLWEDVKSGEFTGFSIGGTALRERLQ